MKLSNTWPLLAVAALAGVATLAAFGGDDSAASKIERGRYLVNAMSCHDCHTPWKLGPQGPEPDMTRMLSGHPAGTQLPPAPVLPEGGWQMVASDTNTAWAGPWGVSFTRNLTPHATGIADWTEEEFIAAMRSGRHRGRGRPILPPMPYFSVAALREEDMQAVFAYLKSLPPIENLVPEPRTP